MIKAMIFDLDGTILDSMGGWTKLDDIFLSENGLVRTPTFENDVKALHFKDMPDYFINTYGISLSREAILERFSTLAYDHYENVIGEKPYVSEFLKKCHEKGIKLCVATATQKNLAEISLKRLGLYDYFDFIVTCDEIGVGKESPDIYIECAKRMDCAPCETAVVEDVLHGIVTAKCAGFYTIAIEDETSHNYKEEIKKQADKYIVSFEELDF